MVGFGDHIRDVVHTESVTFTFSLNEFLSVGQSHFLHLSHRKFTQCRLLTFFSGMTNILVAVVCVLCAACVCDVECRQSRQRIVIHDSAPSTTDASRGTVNAGAAHNRFRSGSAPSPQSSTTSRACPAKSVLRVDFNPSADGDGRIYGNIFGSGVLLASAQDVFEYEIMWKDVDCRCGAEFEVGTQYRLRDNGPMDARGYSPHSERNANMSAVAFGKWYKRQWSMTAVEGKYVDKFVLSALGTPGRTVTAFFKYIRVVRGEEVRRAVFDSGSEPPSVNTYFPGTIHASCQSEVFLTGEELYVQGGSLGPMDVLTLKHDATVAVHGFILTGSLGDSKASVCGSGAFSYCRFFTHWADELEWSRVSRDHRARIQSIEIAVRLVAHPAVVLFTVMSWNSTDDFVDIAPPWHVSASFVVPNASLLTHLLNVSVLDVNAEYSLLRSEHGTDVEWLAPQKVTLARFYLNI